MADATRRLPTNVEGDLFVDETCIDCGACRWMLPTVFDAEDGASRVYRQPDARERARALQAAVACPSGSIGTARRDPEGLRRASSSFPHPMAEGVFHCGYHSEKSFGAASYLVLREEGHVLVDSPRFAKPLVRALEALGGVATMFLTHRDDVADHERFAAHFGCRRIIHRRDRTSRTQGVEQVIEGDAPVELAPGLTVIPTPGHTAGSACLLVGESLFSGDHLAFSRRLGHLYAFRDACWYDWTTQIASMERLAGYRFVRVLPGHGAPVERPAGAMADDLQRCIRWMRSLSPSGW